MYFSYMKKRKLKKKSKKLFSGLFLFFLTVLLITQNKIPVNSLKKNFIKDMHKNMTEFLYAGYSYKDPAQNGILAQIEHFFLPATAYVTEQEAYETDVESELSYELILALEARDENYIDENGQVVRSDVQAEEENGQQEEVGQQEETPALSENRENTEEETQPEDSAADTGASIPTGSSRSKVVEYSMDKLADFDYLVQNFYQVDSTTTIKSDQLNIGALTGKSMQIAHDAGTPQILIYHTHSNEGYADSIPGDAATSVVGVGDYLTSLLTEQYGFSVIHDRGEYDTVRDKAYSKAAPALEAILAENPQIDVIIDLHRDGVGENTRLVTSVDGIQMAKVMFFNGLSRTTALGDISYLYNPYIADNLAFSFQMQLAAAEYYPGYTRKIYLKGYRFNMHYRPKSLLVEVGAQTNTVQEAMNAMVPLADLLNRVLTSQ